MLEIAQAKKEEEWSQVLQKLQHSTHSAQTAVPAMLTTQQPTSNQRPNAISRQYCSKVSSHMHTLLRNECLLVLMAIQTTHPPSPNCCAPCNGCSFEPFSPSAFQQMLLQRSEQPRVL
jgi:hypothetical protein